MVVEKEPRNVKYLAYGLSLLVIELEYQMECSSSRFLSEGAISGIKITELFKIFFLSYNSSEM